MNNRCLSNVTYFWIEPSFHVATTKDGQGSGLTDTILTMTSIRDKFPLCNVDTIATTLNIYAAKILCPKIAVSATTVWCVTIEI